MLMNRLFDDYFNNVKKKLNEGVKLYASTLLCSHASLSVPEYRIFNISDFDQTICNIVEIDFNYGSITREFYSYAYLQLLKELYQIYAIKPNNSLITVREDMVIDGTMFREGYVTRANQPFTFTYLNQKSGAIFSDSIGEVWFDNKLYILRNEIQPMELDKKVKLSSKNIQETMLIIRS